MSRWDACVVGAGPAGSVTALLLARQGARVLLLDRARFPRDKPCSEYLTPETTRVLQRLGDGVLEAVEGRSHARLTGMKLVTPDGTEAVGRFRAGPGYAPPRPYAFALPRTAFDQILVEAAVRAGAELREETTVDDLVWESGAVGGVKARESGVGSRLLRARLVIGADGLRSVVARRLGYRRSGPPRRIAYSAHAADVSGMTDVGEMHIGTDGYVGMGPIGDGETTVALVVPASHASPALTHPEGFVRALDRFPGIRGRFRAERLTRAILATGPFAQWSRASTADGALLVGDAADFFDPFTGQGIYSALTGAELAAGAIGAALGAAESGPIPASALEGYRRGRRRAFAGKWVLERLIGVGVGWPMLATRVVRRLARRPDLADLLVGATGNFIPAGRVLNPATLVTLIG
ncbi:MAG TPA: NAD(P)/FAD-dependent oxidoreductase [Gemmatimonadales bacterium]|jgi:geranylgeranyl reductase family protein|nr:NAD(P)/FAD-dependent oxidoreductase [Gemmatimonadales bacterium]